MSSLLSTTSFVPSVFSLLTGQSLFCCHLFHRLNMLLPRLGAWDFAFCVPFFLSHLFYRSAAQDACPDGDGGTENVASVVVVKQTIHIITSVPHDTTFKVNSELTVAVTNAPTQLDLITTYFYRSTIAQASTRYVPNCSSLSYSY